MSKRRSAMQPADYWEHAGEVGYGEAMYRCSEVERHVRGRCWQTALDIADTLSVPKDGHVLDLGCGDGAFTNVMLAPRFRAVDGLDVAESAIRRARIGAPGPGAQFRAVDITAIDYRTLPRYDAAFLMGILVALSNIINWTAGWTWIWLLLLGGSGTFLMTIIAGALSSFSSQRALLPVLAAMPFAALGPVWAWASTYTLLDLALIIFVFLQLLLCAALVVFTRSLLAAWQRPNARACS